MIKLCRSSTKPGQMSLDQVLFSVPSCTDCGTGDLKKMSLGVLEGLKFMAVTSSLPPVSGLNDLSNESRIIPTPWNRLVRGIGLGQYPIEYDRAVAARIQHALGLLEARVSPDNRYTLFSRLLSGLILNVVDPDREFSRNELGRVLDAILASVRMEKNPYWRLMAGCILIDSFVKLGLDRELLLNEERDFPGEVLAVIDEIQPNQIKDENSGRHGDYEKLSAFTALFLALGQFGLQDRLVSGSRNYIIESLEVLERVPAPFFRGRGGSMLFSAIALLNQEALIFDGRRDFMREVLDYLDRADELNSHPAFPQSLSTAFPKIYPLLTMLNAIAVSNRMEYLTYKKDRLAEARTLLAAISPVEKTHMGLYYIVALHNLGCVSAEVPDIDAFVEDVVGTWRYIDPGQNFFLHGISYSYIIQMAMITGRLDLITDETLERLVDAFPDLDRSDMDRSNRSYPFSYALNMLGEIGAAELFFAPREKYRGRSAMAWVIDGFTQDGRKEGSRLYMLDHALISYALRLRGVQRRETEFFRNFHIGSAFSHNMVVSPSR